MNVPAIPKFWKFAVLWYIANILLQLTVYGCGLERKIIQNVTSGFITDGKGKYASNLRCEWLIESPNPSQLPYITLTFTTRETECVFDYIIVYDGNSHDDQVLGTFSGNTEATSLPSLQAKSGHMLIFFFSDSNYERAGFNASFSIYSCPNNCSGNGQCIGSWCKCLPSWTGNDCGSPACPNDCTDSHHGTCLSQSDKHCSCLAGYLGIGCEIKDDDDMSNANTWNMVYNYTSEQSVPSAFAGHAAVFIQPHLWIFGGYNFSGLSDSFLRYSFSLNQWDDFKTPVRPTARAFHTMTKLTDESHDYLLLFGGQFSQGNYSNELWMYNISQHTWLPINSSTTNKPVALSQHASVVVTINGEQFLYVFGGRTQHRQQDVFSSDMYRLNWKTRTWSNVSYDVAGVKKSRLRIAGHTMVHDKTSGNLVVFGGFVFGKTSTRSNDLFLYHLEKSFWFVVTALNPPTPRAFHSANIIGDYMVVYGGNTHEHLKDETCHSGGLFLYNLICHEWHQPGPVHNVKPSGRFSHASAVSEKNLLFVHGGYDGTFRNELLVYKVPSFAMQLPVSVVCPTHTDINSCLADKKCAWCSKNLHCLSRHNENMTCSHKIKYPVCDGLCNKLDSCLTCTEFNRYVLDTSYKWQQSPCSWCVQDQKCYPFNEAKSGGFCAYGMTRSQLQWWKSPSIMLNTSSMCLESDIPYGFVEVAYHYKNQHLAPDSILKVQSKLDITQAEVDNHHQNITVEVQGFLHILNPDLFPNEKLDFQFVFKHGVVDFYLSKDHSPQLAQRVFPNSLPSASLLKTVTVNRTLSKLSRFYYKITFFSHRKEKLQVKWLQRNQFSTVEYEYLEPFHSPVEENLCKSYHNCFLCLADLTCAWCSGLKLCVTKQKQFENYPLGCQVHNTGISQVTPLTGLIVDAPACPVCADYGSCTDCLVDNSCEWSVEGGCVKANTSAGENIKLASACPDPCSVHQSCGDCISNLHNLQCVWCANSQSCYGFSHHIPSHAFGQCAVWYTKEDTCVNCSAATTCSDCLEQFQCGWCSRVSNALEGKCLPGDFLSSYNASECIVSGDDAKTALQWDYEICPDVDECAVEGKNGSSLHECSANATCINTFHSYSCVCNAGFSGDGKNCHEVCRRKCLHGNCSGHPDYRCICDLGWTTNPNALVDCSVDCGCNFQSTCITGIGVCDRCHHNTNGSLCETCKSGYYKIQSNKTVCKQCKCNRHGDRSVGHCDVTTGNCTCLHNTAGSNCQHCLPGFYGDPRNGGSCYRKCEGRVLFPKTEKAGSFGAWKVSKLLFPDLINCMWVVEAKQDEIIQLIVDKTIQVDCKTEQVFVYDGIPHSVNSTKLASLCGNTWEDAATLFAESGLLTVVYEASRQNLTSLGFNASFSKFSPCSNANNSKNQCRHPRVTSLCPNNCSVNLGNGLCKNGLCHCTAAFTGPGCDLPVSKIQQASYWMLEWDAILHDLSHKAVGDRTANDLPHPVHGHSLLSVGSDLWLFGGRTDNGPVADLFRYATITKTWNKIEQSSTEWPTGRYLHAAATYGNSILVYGGFTFNMSVSNDLWKLDLSDPPNYVWKLVTTPYFVPSMAGHSFTYCGNSLFAAIGGFKPANGLNANVYIFNTSDHSWNKHLPIGGVQYSGVFGHSTIYDQETNLLYVYGGLLYDSHSNTIRPSSRTYTYSLQHKRWAVIIPSPNQPKLFVPPARYFHSAVYYNDGTSRGFLVMGGLTYDNTVESDTWLFRFDCHLWTNLASAQSGKVMGLNLYAAKLGYMMSATSVTSRDSTKSAYYVFGGNRDGVLLHQLQVFRVVSLCYVAKKKCDCEFLRAGCLLCISNEKFICAPLSLSNMSDSQCNLLNNYSSRAENAVSTQTCKPTNTNFNHCSNYDLPARLTHCSQIKDCETCVARVPFASGSYCKWCDSKCVQESHLCVDAFPCDGCHKTGNYGCQPCFAQTCDQCLSQPGNCTWYQLPTTDPNDGWKCSSLNGGNDRVPPQAVPITMERLSQRCPTSCNSFLTCETCLSSTGGNEAGPASCLWSATYRKCISPTQSLLRCADGSCGFVVRPPMASCPVTDCERVTYCSECIRLRECGWFGLDDGTGRGQCRRGAYQAPNNSSAIPGLPSTQWWYMKCPPEDECKNGHHDCSEQPPEFNRCVDTLEGYKCACLTGYERPTPTDKCLPVCRQSCVHGQCVRPDVCECDFAFTGSSCDTACNCSGLSDCESKDRRDICLKCVNNTRGAHCQHCKVGFVGNPQLERLPGESPCVACEIICNGRSTKCVEKTHKRKSSSHVSLSGPKSVELTQCLNCSGNSEGDHCKTCKDGYFMLDNKCRPCACNGHGDTCDRATGADCNCRNNTHTDDTDHSCSSGHTEGGESPSQAPNDCWKKQCNLCQEGFEGDPTDGGQCFRLVHMNQEWCFNPKLQPGCVKQYEREKPELPPGQTLLFALHPKYTNVDIRLLIDVTKGEVDVFISDSFKYFNVSLNPHTWEHVVEKTQKRDKRSPSVKMEEPTVSDSVPPRQPEYRTVDAVRFNNYVTLAPGQAITIRGVKNRLVISSPHVGHDLQVTKFYVILMARKSSLGDVTSDGSHRGKRSPGQSVPAAGRLLFRQDQTRIDLFVFFSVFFSCFFLFLSICIVVWKIKQAVDTQQARLAHHMQLQHMASRPFSCAYVYIDRSPVSTGSRNSTASDQSARSRTLLLDADRLTPSATPLLSSQPTIASTQNSRQDSIPRRIKSCLVKPSSSDGNINLGRYRSSEAFVCGNSPGSPSRQSADVSELRHRAGVSVGYSPVPGVTEESRRHSDNIGQRSPWKEPGERRKRNLMVHFQPQSVMEHSVPLLHTTQGYLTVVAGDDDDCRLTPEHEPTEERLSPVPPTNEKRTSFRQKVFRKSLDVRLPHGGGTEETSFTTPSELSRSISTPVLVKPQTQTKSGHRSSPRISFSKAPTKRSKFRLHRKRSCPVNVGPVSVEPTDDHHAGVATVILQLPNARNLPSSICLGSTLLSTKNMNLPSMSETNTSKAKRTLPLRKRL
uniref:Multiple epidermal growth factor-like domains protein 8 n=1 Tax=Phallusia mammillata TaxID=59560 RepID=A0A6F9DL43_9ASCI|nr:multiple epidermal growth factor-like domains protein 8 [Phallusia mammillata]